MDDTFLNNPEAGWNTVKSANSGEEALCDMIILSRCNEMIFEPDTFFTLVPIYMNPKLKLTLINDFGSFLVI